MCRAVTPLHENERGALAGAPSYLREDFPERDDAAWQKWILLEEKNGEMLVSTEDVPVDDYLMQP